MTPDGKSVLRGIYKFSSTIGLPLWLILIECKDKGFVLDWIDYYESALKLGMSSERVLSRIDSEVVDIYGSEYRDEVMKRLRFYISMPS